MFLFLPYIKIIETPIVKSETSKNIITLSLAQKNSFDKSKEEMNKVMEE